MRIRVNRILLFACALTSLAFGQHTQWSDGTARTIPQNRFEMGILHTPARYGISDNTELITYPLWDALIPGIYVKRFWTDSHAYLITTTHGMFSPTPLLRFVAQEGTGFLLPPDNYVPMFVVLESYLLISRPIINDHIATAKLGGKVAVAIDDHTNDYPPYRRLQTIDYPFIFSRTAFLTKTPGISPSIGISFDGPVARHLTYSFDCSYFFFALRDNLREEEMTSWAFEPSGYLAWHVSDSFTFQVGAAYSIGSYPFGNNWVIYPTVDIGIGFGGEGETGR